MKIRQATKYDAKDIIEMLWHYHDSGNIDGLDVPDESTALKILTMILAGSGIALVAEKSTGLVGMLLAFKAPFLWDNSKYTMNEIAYWVEPEHRGSTAGYRLLAEYVKYCDEQVDEGYITNYTMSQMNGQSLDYSRFGLKPIETTWSN
jgi:GNAT superfamily N-acetyltransferase